MSQEIVIHKPLNVREQKFVNYRLTSDSAAEAARLAGYVSNPASQASRLMRRARVRVAIDVARSKLAEDHGVDWNFMVEKLIDAYYKSENIRDQIRAVREIGLICGLYRSPR
jgi:phage terminase small subunit